MVKTTTALDLPAVAFRGWIDPYADPLESTVESKYTRSLRDFDEMGEAGERHYILLSTLFIKKHDAAFYRKLRLQKYHTMELKQFTDSGECT